MTAAQAHAHLKRLSDKKTAGGSSRFFKTGPGEYGEGDFFLGIKVPQTRQVAKKFKDLKLAEIKKLLRSKFHEERLLALLVLVHQYRIATKTDDVAAQKKIFMFYLANKAFINNWDLVDTSAEHIVGSYLRTRDKKTLDRLAKSKILWDRRIAMLSTFHYIRHHEFKDALRIATVLLHDDHDLIQKAVGWMLREIGNRSPTHLIRFLDRHAAQMPRTMLRYAIEKLSAKRRSFYRHLAQKKS